MPGPASCLLALALGSSVIEAAAGADAEVAVGRAPVDVLGPERDSVAFTLVPGASLRLRSRTSTLMLSYTPRFFYRVPNALEVERPLVLHQVSLSHAAELGRRTALGSSAQFSIGQVDYTASGLVFGQGGSAVRRSVTDVARVEGETGIEHELGRRTWLALGLSGEYTEALDDESIDPEDLMPPAMMPPGMMTPLTPEQLDVVRLPDSARLSAESRIGYALGHRDQLSTGGELSYQWFSDSGRYLLIAPDIAWERQISRRTSLALSAGLAYVITLDTGDDLPGDEAAEGGAPDDDSPDNSLGGTGSIEISSELYQAHGTRVSGGASASLEWFFDPIAGTAQPRAGAEANLDIAFGRDWRISPSVAFYTLFRSASVQGDAAEQALLATPDATSLRIEIPFEYDVSRALSLNFGARSTLRGRALSEPDFDLAEQVEIWAFVGATLRVATGDDDDGAWLPL